MTNPDPEAFTRNVDFIQDNFLLLSTGDRRYMNILLNQMYKKQVEDFNRKQFNMVNEIARKLRSKVRRLKKNHPASRPE